jgi:signal transduction histidine kinase
MNLQRLKIGTLLGGGMVLIIGVMISTTIFSNYLSNSAQEIIRESTTKSFNAINVQNESERFFSSLDETIVILKEGELNIAQKRSEGLLNGLRTTLQQSKDEQVFSEDDLQRAETVLVDLQDISKNYFSLKREMIREGTARGRTFEGGYSTKSRELSDWFDKLANQKYAMLGIVANVIMNADEESQKALSLVRWSQIVSWVVVGISLVLAITLAFFLIRSAKKILDLKNEFINIIAHDLRNPVTAILGYLDIIQTGKDMKLVDVKKQLKIVEVAAHRLRGQINNLLVVGRSEAGYVKVEIEPVEVAGLLQESVIRAMAFADTKGMKIVYDKPVSAGIYILADKHKFSDVIDNLISNAIKYNKKEGLVTITSRAEGDNFNISVTDTGYGIPEDKKDKMFKKYSRLDSSSKERVGGTGLGLYTAKMSMEQMKGTITFTTKVNEGTTFTVSFQKTEKKKVTT